MIKQRWRKFTIKCKDKESAKEVAEMIAKNALVQNVKVIKTLVMYEQYCWGSEDEQS